MDHAWFDGSMTRPPEHAKNPLLPPLALCGPFLASRAIADGLTTRARLNGPGWRRILADVYLGAEAPLDHLTRCQAALLIAPPGTVCGFTSALGLYCPELRPAPGDPVELIVPRRTNVWPRPELRVHRMTLVEGDTEVCGGFPTTTPARTAFDLARSEDLVEAVVWVDALLATRRTSIEEISQYMARGLPGTSRATKALELAAVRVESPMETRTRLLLVLNGLPRPEVQYEVYTNGFFVARLDLAYPECRIGVEYDGDHHRQRRTFQNDAVRANELERAEWRILRFTVDDIQRHPERVLRQVRMLLQAVHRDRRH